MDPGVYQSLQESQPTTSLELQPIDAGSEDDVFVESQWRLDPLFSMSQPEPVSTQEDGDSSSDGTPPTPTPTSLHSPSEKPSPPGEAGVETTTPIYMIPVPKARFGRSSPQFCNRYGWGRTSPSGSHCSDTTVPFGSPWGTPGSCPKASGKDPTVEEEIDEHPWDALSDSQQIAELERLCDSPCLSPITCNQLDGVLAEVEQFEVSQEPANASADSSSEEMDPELRARVVWQHLTNGTFSWYDSWYTSKLI